MGYRILVVDDSPVLRIMLGEMLQELGHDVVAEVESGNEALEAYPKHRPDLVCLDVSLPDINGMDVLAKLRRIDPHAKVLIVTGNDQKALEAKALSLRALGVLHKPFDVGELKEMLEKVGVKKL
ncbi:MAG: two-component system response regulator [Elusimicrobia bacterium]|nr:MAG: two-component system response regulator [Elusimicrobiota bacterium]